MKIKKSLKTVKTGMLFLIFLLSVFLVFVSLSQKSEARNEPLPFCRICIDPGHGGNDPGALGWDDMRETARGSGSWTYVSGNPPNEKDFTLDIGLRLRNIIESRTDTAVIMTRATDVYVSLPQRVNIANQRRCDLFVSIHNNAGSDPAGNPHPAAHGTETYWGKPMDEDFARAIQPALVRAINRRDRGVHQANFYVLRNTDMPAALVEVAFITNNTEFNLLNQPAFRQLAAEGIYNGIRAHARSLPPELLPICPEFA